MKDHKDSDEVFFPRVIRPMGPTLNGRPLKPYKCQYCGEPSWWQEGHVECEEEAIVFLEDVLPKNDRGGQ